MAKKNKILVYYADAGALNDAALFDAAYALISDERKAKTDRRNCKCDKFLSLASEILLLYALKKAGFKSAPEFYCGENGKPYLKEIPLFFSISHSENTAVCAIAESEIGCDTEKIKTAPLKVSKRFFESSEYADILSAPKDKQSELFYRYWTLKESYLKADGTGLKKPLSSFRVKIDGEKASLDNRQVFFKETNEIKGYKCAVCHKDKNAEVCFIKADLKEIIEELK